MSSYRCRRRVCVSSTHFRRTFFILVFLIVKTHHVTDRNQKRNETLSQG